MPIYAFRCDACGHAFDRLQKLSDADPETCPSCQEAAVRRQLTAPAFRLAGSGWYETDFKKDGDKKRNLADKGDAPSKSDSDNKSDSNKGSSAGSENTKSKTTSDGAKSASSGESGSGKTAASGSAAPPAAN